MVLGKASLYKCFLSITTITIIGFDDKISTWHVKTFSHIGIQKISWVGRLTNPIFPFTGTDMSPELVYPICPNAKLWRQIEGPYSAYCSLVWQTR